MRESDSTTRFSGRDDALREANVRIKELGLEIHRLRARLSRLEADGEDEKADRLASELQAREEDIARDRGVVERLAVFDKPSPQPFNGSTAGVDVGHPSEPADVEIDAGDGETATTVRSKQHRRQAFVAWRDVRKQPAWVVSVLVHGLVLFLFGWLTFATIHNPPPLLSSGTIDGLEDVADELTDVEFEPVELDDAMLSEAVFETISPEVTELELDEPFASTELAHGPPVDALGVTDLLAMDVGSLLTGIEGGANDGDGASGGGPKSGKIGEAKFFGARSRGNRFVFLIDNSGTMKAGRMETAFMELINSVGAMKPDQRFYVVFYSDQAYPMFHPEPVDDLVPATRDNKKKLESWLTTVEMCTGGELNDAVDMAAALEPSAVYLLSDGDIVDSRIERLLDKADEREFRIYTFGMTVRNPDHAAKLIAIAQTHKGTFTPVSVNPVAAQMSRARPIRYNREPGRVWGSKIRK